MLQLVLRRNLQKLFASVPPGTIYIHWILN